MPTVPYRRTNDMTFEYSLEVLCSVGKKILFLCQE